MCYMADKQQANTVEMRHAMDKSLKKLSRMELLELLLKASETNELLARENDELRRSAAKQRTLPQSAKVGSIAEAALQVSGFFESAQRAADEYLREIKRLRDQIAARAADPQAAARTGEIQASQQMQPVGTMPSGMPMMVPDAQVVERRAQAYLRDAQAQADGIIAKANQQARAIVSDARSRSEAAIADANRQAQQIIAHANRRADVLLNAVQSRNQALPADQAVQSAHVSRTGQVSHIGQAATGPIRLRGRHARIDSDMRTA